MVGGQSENLGKIKMEALIELKKFRQQFKEVIGTIKQVDPAARKATDSMNKLEKGTKSAGETASRTSKFFKSMFAQFTLANLATKVLTSSIMLLRRGLVGMLKVTFDFETSLVQVRKVTNATKAEIESLSEFIKDLAVETGIAKVELAEIAAGGGRLGIFAREGARGLQAFTRTIALTQIAMEDYAGSAEEAAAKTAVLLNLFGLEAKDAEELLSVINELSNTAAATSGQISENVRGFASLSGTFDASKESLLAMATTLQEVGGETQAFGTAFQAVLIEMQNDTSKFAKFLGDDLGPEFEELFKTEPVEAFALFLKGLNTQGRNVGKTLKALEIGERRAIREFSKLATDKGIERFAKNLETAKEAADDAADAVLGIGGATSSLQAEATRALDTVNAKLDQTGEALSNVGESLGKELTPATKEWLDIFKNGLQELEPIAIAIGKIVGATLGLLADLARNFDKIVNRIPKLRLIGSALKLLPGRDKQAPPGEASVQDLLAGGGGAADLLGLEGVGELPEDEKKSKAASKKAEERLKIAVELERDRLQALKAQLEVRRDTLGLTRKEARALERLVAFQDDAFDIRNAKDMLGFLKALEKQADALAKDYERASDAIKDGKEQLKEMLEDSKERVKDLRIELSQLNEEFEKEFGAVDLLGERQAELAKDLADAAKEAKDIKATFEAGLFKGTPEELRDALETVRRVEDILSGVTNLAQPLVDEIAKQLEMNTEQAKRNAAERLEAEFEAEKELAEEKLEAERERNELSQELEEAAQEDRLEAFLEENEDRLDASQKRHAEEIMQERQKVEMQISMATQAQQQITQLYLENIQLRDNASQIFSDNEIGRLQALQVQAIATIKAIAAARTAVTQSTAGGFAEGGAVVGPGTDKSDNIHAMLSPGEHVITAEEVRGAGGHGMIMQLRDLMRNGLNFNIPKFADGGAVSTDNSKHQKISVTQNFPGNSGNANNSPRAMRWHLKKLI